MNNYYNPYELYHHGIKGQKWGVRRFQNVDGSLTKAGQLRYETKDARKEYGKAFDRAYTSRYSQLGITKAGRENRAEAYNELNKATNNYLNKRAQYRIEKKREKGASEEKLARMQERADYDAKKRAGRERIAKAANDAYAQESTGRHIITSLLAGAGSKSTIAALEASGMSHKGSVAVSLLLGHYGSESIAMYRSDKQVRDEYRKSKNG